MIKYYYDVEQGSDEWHALRRGVITASTINTLLTPTGKPATGANISALAQEIVAQKVTGRTEYNFQSFDMIRGHIQEDIARDIYAETYGEVKQCGFIFNEVFGIGASPDGLVGDDGGIEIKSRLAKFQIDTIAKGKMDMVYYNQCQTFLLVSGRKWIDFVQYSNGLPLYVERVYPDSDRQDSILNAVFTFQKACKDLMDVYENAQTGLVKTEYVDINFDEDIEGSEQ